MSDLYQLKITLAYSEPPIWRRILVPEDMTLSQLHITIQECFEWDQSHLFAFRVGDRTFDDQIPQTLNTKLYNLSLKPKKKFHYTYDFGDDWEHIIVFEKALKDESSYKLPYCLDGERAGPPDDCGGIPGYEQYLEVLTDPNHDDFEEISEWLSETYNNDQFRKNEINKRLACMFIADMELSND